MIAVAYFTILGEIARATSSDAVDAVLAQHTAKYGADIAWPDFVEAAERRKRMLPGAAVSSPASSPASPSVSDGSTSRA